MLRIKLKCKNYAKFLLKEKKIVLEYEPKAGATVTITKQFSGFYEREKEEENTKKDLVTTS